MDGKVGALGKVVPEQAVHVLVAAALPGAVRLAEEHRHRQGAREVSVGAEFFALVPGQAAPQSWGQAREHLREGVSDGDGGPASGEVHQDQTAAGTFNQRADR